MPRMFDILKSGANDNNKKKNKEKRLHINISENKKEKGRDLDHSLNFPKKILAAPEAAKKEIPEDHTLASKKLISVAKTHGVDNQEKTQALYDDGIEIIRRLLRNTRDNEDLNPCMGGVEKFLDDIFNQFILGDSILNNIHDRIQYEYYLPYHIVNVLLLSSFLGIKMGFNKSRMKTLGMACIFYDIGMDAFREIVNRPATLNKEEYDLVKKHVLHSVKIVEKISGINKNIKEIIETHHERTDGSGYPLGIKSDKINPYAKIIGLIDTYEALAHYRPHRQGINAHEAIKFLLGSIKDSFDYDALRVFIDKMSIYPIGAIVRLDTGEIARVIEAKPGSPLCPIVMIIRDSEGATLEDSVIADLSMEGFPSIVESI